MLAAIFGASSASAQSLLHAETYLEVMEYTVVHNPGAETDAMSAGGDARIHQMSDVTSDLLATGAITIESYAAVYGDVTSGSTVTVEANGYVGGTTTANSAPTINAPIPLISVVPGTTDVAVPLYSTQTLSPGDFDLIHVGEGATLIVPAGTYSIDNLQLDQSARIVPQGVVRFDVKSIVSVGMWGQLTPDTGVAGRVILTIDQATIAPVAFGDYSEFTGEIYSPLAPATFGIGTTLVGAALAKDISIGQNSVVTLTRFTPAPLISIAGVTPNTTTTASVTYTVSVSDADNNIVQVNGADAEVTLDGVAANMTGTVTADGVHTLTATSTDSDGNVAGQSAVFTIDQTGPVVTTVGAQDGATYRQPFVILSFNAVDAFSNPSTATALLDGVAVSSGTVVDTAGPHTLDITGVDALGNTTVASTTFYMLYDSATSAFANTVFLYGEDTFVIENNASLTGGAAVYAGLGLSITTDTTAAVDVFGASTVSLGAGTSVTGDVVIGGVATVDATASITGSLTENQVGLPMPTIPIDDRAPNTNHITVSSATTLAPGTYGNLVVNAYTTLNLSGGTYVFDTMTLADGAQVLADAEVDVFVASSSTMGGGAAIDSGAVGVNATDMRFIFGATTAGLTVGANCTLTGKFFAPGGTIDVGTSTVATGSIWAKDLIVRAFATLTFQIPDNLPPTIEIGGVAEGQHYSAASVQPMIAAYDDDLVSLDATVDGVAVALDVAVTAEGSHTLVVTAVDAIGGITVESVTFVIDRTAPALVVVGADDAECYASPHDVTFSATDTNLLGVGAEIGGTTISTPHTLTADGEYVFTALADDIAGNAQAMATVFEVDGTPPLLTVTGVVEGASYTTAVMIDVDVLDINLVSFDVVLDGAVVDPSAGTFTVTLPGAHTLHADATDCAGNTASVDVAFSVDNGAPEITIAGVAPDAVLNVASVTPTFTVVDSDLQSTTATLNGAAFVSGTVVSAEGDYTLVVTATDAAANVSTSTLAFAIDRTAPSITIVDPVDDQCTSTAVTLAYGATDAHLLDTSAYLNGIPVDVNDVVSAEGHYVLFVSAVDQAYIVDNATAGFTVDTTVPTVDVIGVVEGATYASEVTIDATGTDDNLDAVVLTIDGAAFTAGAYNIPGAHALVATATDCAGNETTSTVNFTIDNVAPTITVTGVVDAVYSKDPLTISYSATDASATTVSATLAVDGGAPFAFTSGTVVTAEAAYELTVSAEDAAGNTATEVVTFSVDATAPTLALLAPVDGSLVGAETVTISVTATDVSLLDVRIGANELLPQGADTFTSTLPVVEGPQQFAIVARDFAGNETSVTLDVTSDNVYPVLDVTSPVEDERLTTSGVVVTGTVSDANGPRVTVAGGDVPLNGGAFSQGVTLIPGENVIRVEAVDDGGNKTAVSRTVRMNGTPPTVAITSPLAGAALDSPITVTGTVGNSDANDNPGTNTVVVNGVSAMVSTGGVFTAYGVILGAGQQTFTATATDLYGLQASAQQTVTITGGNTDAGVPDPDAGTPDAGAEPDVDAGSPPDALDGGISEETPPPALAIETPVEGLVTRASTVLVTGTIDQGTAPFTVTVNGTAASVFGASFTLAIPVDEGSLSIGIVATDDAGRTASETRTVIVDRTLPYLAVSDPVDNPATVTMSPYLVMGSVADSNLGAVTVAGQTVSVFGGHFQASVALDVGQTTVSIVATDLAGNRAMREQVLILDTPVPLVSFVTPSDGQEISTASAPVEVGVVSSETIASVSVNGITASDVGGGRYQATVTLGSGETTLTATATDTAGGTGTASIAVVSQSEENLPLEVVRVTPEAGSIGAERNTSLTVSFNKPIVRTSLATALTVEENGEVVPGGLYIAPGDIIASFSPSRPFAYKSRVTIDLSGLDAQTGPGLASHRSDFTVRAPTTVLRGVVTDATILPRSGVAVSVVSSSDPTRVRETLTDVDGNWAVLDLPAGRVAVTFDGGRNAAGDALPKVTRHTYVTSEKDNNLGRMPLVKQNESTGVFVQGASSFTVEFGSSLQAGQADQADYAGLSIGTATAGALFFEDGTSSGLMTATKIPSLGLPYAVEGNLRPANVWQFGPGRFQTPGALTLSFPNLEGVPAGRHVLMVALDPENDVLRVVGAAKVNEAGDKIEALESVELPSLDFVGYVPLTEAQDAAVRAVITAALDVDVDGDVDGAAGGRLGPLFQAPRDAEELERKRSIWAEVFEVFAEALVPSAQALGLNDPSLNQMTNAALLESGGFATVNGKVFVRGTQPLRTISGASVTLTTSDNLGTVTNENGTFGIPLAVAGPEIFIAAMAELPLPNRPQLRDPLSVMEGQSRIERVPSSLFAISSPQDISAGDVYDMSIPLEAIVFQGAVQFQSRDGHVLETVPGVSEQDQYDSESGELTHVSRDSIETTEIHILRYIPAAPDGSEAADESSTGSTTVPYARYAVVSASDPSPADVDTAHGVFQRIRPRAFSSAINDIETEAVGADVGLAEGDHLVLFAINHQTGFAGIAEVTLPALSQLPKDGTETDPDGGVATITDEVFVDYFDGGAGASTLSRGVVLNTPIVLFPSEIEIRVERKIETLGAEQDRVTLAPLIRSGASATAQDSFVNILSHWKVRKKAARDETDGYDGGPLDPFSDLPDAECPPGADAGCVHEMSDDDYSVTDDAGSARSIGKYLRVTEGDLPKLATAAEKSRSVDLEKEIVDVPSGVPALAGQLVVVSSAASTIVRFPIEPGANTPVSTPATGSTPLSRGNYYVHVVGYPVAEFDKNGDGILTDEEVDVEIADFSEDLGAQKPGFPKNALALKSVYRRRPRGQSHRNGDELPEYFDPVREMAFRVVSVEGVEAVAGIDSSDPRQLEEGNGDEQPSAEAGDDMYSLLYALIEPDDSIRGDENIGEYQVRLGGDASGLDCEISTSGTSSYRADCGGPLLTSVISALDVVYMELFQRGNAENILTRFNFLGLSERTDCMTAQSAFTADKGVTGYPDSASVGRVLRAPISNPNKAIFFVDGEEMPDGAIVNLCVSEECTSDGDPLVAFDTTYDSAGEEFSFTRTSGSIPDAIAVAELELRGYGRTQYFAQAIPPDLAKMDIQENEGATIWVVVRPNNADANSLPEEISRATGLPRGRYDGCNAFAPGQTRVAGVNLAGGGLARSYTDWSVPEKGVTRRFTRTYNNLLHEANPLGTGWMHNYEGYIREEVPGRYQVMLEGQSYDFPICSGGGGAPINCENDKAHGGRLSVVSTVDPLDSAKYSSFTAVFDDGAGTKYTFSRESRREKTLGGRKYLLTEIDDPLSSPIVIGYRDDIDAQASDVVANATRSGGISFEFVYEELAPTDVHPITGAIVRAFKMPRLSEVNTTSGPTMSLILTHDHGDASASVLSVLSVARTTTGADLTWTYTYDSGNEEFVQLNEMASESLSFAGGSEVHRATFVRDGGTAVEPYQNSDVAQRIDSVVENSQSYSFMYGAVNARGVEFPNGSGDASLNSFGNVASISTPCGTSTAKWESDDDDGAVVPRENTSTAGDKTTCSFTGLNEVETCSVAIGGGMTAPPGADGAAITLANYDEQRRPGTLTAPSSIGNPQNVSNSYSGAWLTEQKVGDRVLWNQPVNADGQPAASGSSGGYTVTYGEPDAVFGQPSSMTVTCNDCPDTVTLADSDVSITPVKSVTSEYTYDHLGRRLGVSTKYNDGETPVQATTVVRDAVGRPSVISASGANVLNAVVVYLREGDTETISTTGSYGPTLTSSSPAPLNMLERYEGGFLAKSVDKDGVETTYERSDGCNVSSVTVEGGPNAGVTTVERSGSRAKSTTTVGGAASGKEEFDATGNSVTVAPSSGEQSLLPAAFGYTIDGTVDSYETGEGKVRNVFNDFGEILRTEAGPEGENAILIVETTERSASGRPLVQKRGELTQSYQWDVLGRVVLSERSFPAGREISGGSLLSQIEVYDYDVLAHATAVSRRVEEPYKDFCNENTEEAPLLVPCWKKRVRIEETYTQTVEGETVYAREEVVGEPASVSSAIFEFDAYGKNAVSTLNPAGAPPTTQTFTHDGLVTKTFEGGAVVEEIVALPDGNVRKRCVPSCSNAKTIDEYTYGGGWVATIKTTELRPRYQDEEVLDRNSSSAVPWIRDVQYYYDEFGRVVREIQGLSTVAGLPPDGDADPVNYHVDPPLGVHTIKPVGALDLTLVWHPDHVVVQYTNGDGILEIQALDGNGSPVSSELLPFGSNENVVDLTFDSSGARVKNGAPSDITRRKFSSLEDPGNFESPIVYDYDPALGFPYRADYVDGSRVYRGYEYGADSDGYGRYKVNEITIERAEFVAAGENLKQYTPAAKLALGLPSSNTGYYPCDGNRSVEASLEDIYLAIEAANGQGTQGNQFSGIPYEDILDRYRSDPYYLYKIPCSLDLIQRADYQSYSPNPEATLLGWTGITLAGELIGGAGGALALPLGLAVRGTSRFLAKGAAKSLGKSRGFVRGAVGRVRNRLSVLRQAGECPSGVCITSPGCFVSGTLVTTAHGPVPIEDVQLGDLVWSRSDVTGDFDWKAVTTRTITEAVDVWQIVFENDAIETTSEHPFWVRGVGWLPAADVRDGDEVYSLDSGWITVGTSTKAQYKATVYNFEVDDFHTYFVGKSGAWVHNQCRPELIRRFANEGLSGVALRRAVRRAELPEALNISGKQFGRKVSKRMGELGLDVRRASNRANFRSRLGRIFKNADEARLGFFRGQGPGGGVGEVLFLRRGHDVLVTSRGGDFVTLLVNGHKNKRFLQGLAF